MWKYIWFKIYEYDNKLKYEEYKINWVYFYFIVRR